MDEVSQSVDLCRTWLQQLADDDTPCVVAPRAIPALTPDQLAVSQVEAWRGAVTHVAITDSKGRLAAYKVIDPSFHNWAGLAMALRDGRISDFPLCNKSFNLSYCGHDL